MDVSAIWAQLQEMSPASSADQFVLAELGTNLFLSRTHQGNPALVVTFSLGMNLPRGLETKGLRLAFYPAFAVQLAGTTTTAPCGLLYCVDPAQEWPFCVMAAGMVARLLTEPAWLARPSALLRHVSDWQSLLARDRGLTAEEEVGLWGELCLLLETPSPATAISHWHGPEAKWFDFSAPGTDLEVKTSVLGHRHHFRLQQLAPSPSGQDRLVCSQVVEEDPAGGRSVDDLVEEVRAFLPDSLPFEEKLLQLCWRPDPEERRLFSLRDRRLVHVSEIPSVYPEPGVTEVSFLSDLSGCKHVARTEEVAWLSRLCIPPVEREQD